MLFGNIENLELLTYVDNKLLHWIQEALIASAGKPDGKYQLKNDAVFVIIASAKTELMLDRRAEIHKDYIDVQIVLEGEERIGHSCHLENEIKVLETLENDIAFFDSVKNEQFIDLRAGDFAVFYPNEQHRPLCALNAACNVKKAIIKIPKILFI